MTRQQVEQRAFPVVMLKQELVEFKLRRLDSILEVAGKAETPDAKLLAVAKTLLDSLGADVYGHKAAAYWQLRLRDANLDDSMTALQELSCAVAVPEATVLLEQQLTVVWETLQGLHQQCDYAEAARVARAIASRQSPNPRWQGMVQTIRSWCGTQASAPADVSVNSEAGMARPVYTGADDPVLGRRVFRSSYDPADIEEMQRALSDGGNPDWVDASRRDGFTAMIKASRAGRADMVQLLLEHGANPDKPSTYGCTPLVYAVGARKPDVVRVLLSWRADLDIPAESGQHAGQTAENLARTAELKDLLAQARDGTFPLHELADGHRAAPLNLDVEQTDEQRSFSDALHACFLREVTGAEAVAAALPIWEWAVGRDAEKQQELLVTLTAHLPRAGAARMLTHRLRASLGAGDP